MMEQSRLDDFDIDNPDKSKNDEWTFAGADTKQYTHGLHPYPARMIPQVTRKLILRYSKARNLVWDPFCGSGSTLVESMLNSRKSVGTDLNPFAIFLSKVKTTPISPAILRKMMTKIDDEIELLRKENRELETPPMHNIDHYYKKHVQHDLAVIKTAVDAIDDEEVKDFFRLCFASTARASSNLRKGEFKIVRMKKEKVQNFNPDSFEIFRKHMKRCIPLMASFKKDLPEEVFPSRVLYSDNRNPPIDDESIDLVVTSPPYGDHSTTVAYGQFSRYPAHWIGLDYDAVKSVDRRGLGGTSPKVYEEFLLESESLNTTYQKVYENKPKRAKEFFNFFFQYNQSIESMYKKLKTGGRACIVIGNRLMARVRIPTDKITTELGIALGFEHETTIPRNIPTKRMPWKNAPENIEGFKADTMHNEHIVILHKP